MKTAVSGQREIFLEMHKDLYGKCKNPIDKVLQVIKQPGVAEKVNREKVESMLKKKSGIAEDITL